MNTAKPDDDIPLEAGLDFPDPVPTIQAEPTPLRDDDREPSCSIYAEGTCYKDQGTGESGDSFELFKAVKKLDRKTDWHPYLELAGIPVPHRSEKYMPHHYDWTESARSFNSGLQREIATERGLDVSTFAWLAAGQTIGLHLHRARLWRAYTPWLDGLRENGKRQVCYCLNPGKGVNL
jgi:hypothetical protein